MRYCSLTCSHVISIASKTTSAMWNSDSKFSVVFKQIFSGHFNDKEKVKKMNFSLDVKRTGRMLFRAHKYCEIGYL